jgi:ABC-type branched-subunit amino acid transport system ATPase component
VTDPQEPIEVSEAVEAVSRVEPIEAETVDLAPVRPTIRIQNAAKSFDGRTVVDVDDLVLGDRQIEGLIGPNGAGKTTLMRMIMHSTRLDRGTITFFDPERGVNGSGVVLSRLQPYQVARLGVVKTNQVFMDFEKLTILDSLLLSVAQSKYEQPYRIFSEGRVFDDNEDRILEHLEYFGFEDPFGFANSAGEKKLLDIIRCLLLEPRFLLLDEPTAGLPEETTELVMEVVQRLAAEGTSVVIVEHDLNVIWSLSHQVSFMAEGSVIMQGDPQEIREHRTVVEKYLGEGHV